MYDNYTLTFVNIIIKTDTQRLLQKAKTIVNKYAILKCKVINIYKLKNKNQKKNFYVGLPRPKILVLSPVGGCFQNNLQFMIYYLL